MSERGAARVKLWAALTALVWSVFVVSDAITGLPFRPLLMAVLAGLCALVWVLLAGGVWRLAERWPLGSPPRPARLLAHGAAAMLLAGLFVLAFGPLVALCYGAFVSAELSLADGIRGTAQYYFFAQVLFYAVVVVAQQSSARAAALRDADVARAETEARLGRARLDVLRARMRPHFLFNVLNAVSSLLGGGESKRADATLRRLAELLRAGIDEGQGEWSTLEEELVLVEHHLELARCRFGERLDAEVDVPDALLGTVMPRWVLAPLVENALLHGVEASPDAAWLRVSASREADTLVLLVEDDGPGPPDELRADTNAAPADTHTADDDRARREEREGLGLGHTRARLAALYAGAAALTLGTRPDGGCVARLVLPARPKPEPS